MDDDNRKCVITAEVRDEKLHAEEIHTKQEHRVPLNHIFSFTDTNDVDSFVTKVVKNVGKSNTNEGGKRNDNIEYNFQNEEIQGGLNTVCIKEEANVELSARTVASTGSDKFCYESQHLSLSTYGRNDLDKAEAIDEMNNKVNNMLIKFEYDSEDNEESQIVYVKQEGNIELSCCEVTDNDTDNLGREVKYATMGSIGGNLGRTEIGKEITKSEYVIVNDSELSKIRDDDEDFSEGVSTAFKIEPEMIRNMYSKLSSKVDVQQQSPDEILDYSVSPYLNYEDEVTDSIFVKLECDFESNEESQTELNMAYVKKEADKELSDYKYSKQIDKSSIRIAMKIKSEIENCDEDFGTESEEESYELHKESTSKEFWHDTTGATRIPPNGSSRLNTRSSAQQSVNRNNTTTLSQLKAHVSHKHKKYARFKRKMYMCGLCKYRAKYSSELKLHKNNVHFSVKPYECDLCEYKASSSTLLNYHKRSKHLNKKPHECDMCDFKSALLDTLKQHKRIKHLSEKLYKCDICEYKCSHISILRKHKLRKDHKKKPSNCDLCEYKCNFAISLKYHKVSKHSNEELYKCDLCEYQSTTVKQVRSHKSHKHQKKHQCDLCNYKAALPAMIRQHKARKHSGEKPFVCELCAYKAVCYSDLKRHKKSRHSDEKPFACDLCEYRTIYARSVKQHKLLKHSKVRPYHCDLCEHKSATASMLKAHKKSVHFKEKRYICDLCEYSARTFSELRVHKNYIHYNKRLYECDLCEYKTTNRNLNYHKQSKHFNDKPHKCDLCDYETVLLNTLKQHKRNIHSNEKRYECDICAYKCNSVSHLKTHRIYKHHKEKQHKCNLCEYICSSAMCLKEHKKYKH